MNINHENTSSGFSPSTAWGRRLDNDLMVYDQSNKRIDNVRFFREEKENSSEHLIFLMIPKTHTYTQEKRVAYRVAIATTEPRIGFANSGDT